MKRLEVPLGARTYPVLIGPGLLGDPALWDRCLGDGRVLVLTNERVAPLYLDTVMDALGDRPAGQFVLPDGETHKTVASWTQVLDELVRQQAGRDACVITLGGGVIGDLGGFAAASYMRGVDFIQAPTTLLAQVDASVGGKTGVNHERGKNLIGAFHQPRAVLADTATLDTLPPREFIAGLAEVVKYGIIRDPELFCWMESSCQALLDRDADALAHAVERSVMNKAEVVAADEREAGSRALLNLGHSFGHALETLTAYTELLHGEAVAIGTVVACRVSEIRGLAGDGLAERVSMLLSRLGLPVAVPDHVPSDAILRGLVMDKKAVQGQCRLILPEGIGSARIDASSAERDILAALDDCRT